MTLTPTPSSSKPSLTIRRCSTTDLDDIMALQEHICETMTNPDLFVATGRRDNADYLLSPNAIFGVYDGTRLTAYGSLVFPNDAPENLGHDLGWHLEKILCCATLDTIVVDPDYRGLGLQRRLIQECLSYARCVLPDCIVLTTVSPFNEYSLRNVQSQNFQILKRLIKYGGHERYILGNLPDPLPSYPAFEPSKEAFSLPVTPILQNPELPTGCESVALTMALNYYGYGLAKAEIAEQYLPKDPENFVTSFKGDPHDPDGDGIYAPGLVKTASLFLSRNGNSRKAFDLTGTELSDLYAYLKQSVPVLVYNSVYLKTPDSTADYTSDGKTWKFYHNEHCVVLCGYDPVNHKVLVSDSLSGLIWRDEAKFRQIYDALGKMAVVIF